MSQSLGIPFYDKELIDLAAKENGMKTDYVAAHEQNIPSNLLYEMIMQDFTAPVERSLSFDDALFVTQSKIIRKLATEQSCIIVGRCADYVLRDFSSCLKVFVHADYEDKLQRIVQEYGEQADAAREKLKYTDRGRANHYKTYTGQVWNEATHYDLCLNSTRLGISGCCDLILKMLGKEQNING